MKKIGKKCILIVDDELEVCRTICDFFIKRGFETSYALNGSDGLENVKKEKPDLIILDVLMPKMDGFELLQHLKSHPSYSKIPIIMLTTKSDSESLDKGISLKADFYLPKPFSLQNLMKFVKISI